MIRTVVVVREPNVEGLRGNQRQRADGRCAGNTLGCRNVWRAVARRLIYHIYWLIQSGFRNVVGVGSQLHKGNTCTQCTYAGVYIMYIYALTYINPHTNSAQIAQTVAACLFIVFSFTLYGVSYE